MPELQQLYEMIDEIEVAMMTTRREDGHLESRAMATQKRAAGADLWFVAADGTGKLADIERDPHVNLAYYKDWHANGSPFPAWRRSRVTGRRPGSSTQPTGRSGLARTATPVMALRTILVSC